MKGSNPNIVNNGERRIIGVLLTLSQNNCSQSVWHIP